jgi:hypothetical protein
MRGIECSCPAGTCQQQPKAEAVPLFRPTNRDMLFVFVTCIVLAVIVGGTVHALQVAEREYQLQLRIG